MGTTLTGTYHSTVKLDQGSIGATVTLGISGIIAVGFYGGAGIFGASSVANAYVVNKGIISGGSNGGTATAGAGIYLGARGTIVNGYEIYGGAGAAAASGNGFAGGAGVDLAGGGLLMNSLKIAGGLGGLGNTGTGGAGGAGVFAIGATNIDSGPGFIYGGNGGNGATLAGNGGVGVFLDGSGTLTNSGIIGGGSGGNGGGATGGIGVFLDNGAALYNQSVIVGGGGGTGDAGGVGLLAEAAGTVTNHYVIRGGAGAATTGGAGTVGGVGVELASGTSASNYGTIKGGAGGTSTYVAGETATGMGGNGGTGLQVNESTGSIYNIHYILGGDGGVGDLHGGIGGTGVILEGGASLTNTGTIAGGYGGDATGASGVAGNGGIGVYLDGGTLTNASLISGGTGGQGPGVTIGAQGVAIVFGGVAATLILDPGAQFNGNVIANQAASDLLELAGTTAGSITGLGTQFTGFSTVAVDFGAQWTLFGAANTASAQETLYIDGALSIAGSLVAAGAVDVASSAELQTTGTGVLQLAELALNGGTLAASSQGTFVFGTSLSLGVAGAVTVESRELLAGWGTIAGAIAGTGAIEASGGNLIVTGAAAGSLALSAAANNTLVLNGGGTLGAVSGKGALLLEDTAPFTLAAHNSIKITSLIVGESTSLSGAGTITSKLANNSLVTAAGGELLLKGAVSGNGTFAAAGGATLDFAGGVKTAGVMTGAGEIRFDGASSLGAGAALSASSVVDAANLTLGKGVSLTTAFQQSFAIDPTAGGTVTLSGATGDTFTNAGSFTGGGAGTADVGIAFVNNANVSAGSGTLSFLGSVTNNGVMTASGGDLTIAGSVGGNGTLVVGPSGTLTLDGATGGSQFVQFLSLNGTLDLAQPNAFGSLINDFGANCKIDLLNTASTTFTFNGGVLTVDNGTTAVASLQFIGPYNTPNFAIASDNHGGTMLTFI